MVSKEEHEGCHLRSKTTPELKDICIKALDEGNLSEAFHCAEHHLKLCHAGIDSGHVDFMHEHLPSLAHVAVDVGGHLSDQLKKSIADQTREQLSDAPFQMKLAAGAMQSVVATDAQIVATMSFLVGAHMSMYVATRAEYCLFGLIDPDLCKE